MDSSSRTDGFRNGAYCFNVLRSLFEKDGTVKITCTQGEPFENMTTVTLVGKKIMFDNPRWFLKIGKLASNFEAYPTTTGIVALTFTFYDTKGGEE